MQVVYADVLWLIDFSMDLLSLGIAGRMTQRPARAWRLCAAAGVGGLYAVLALLLNLGGVGGLLLDFAVAAGMVWLAFGSSPPMRFALTFGGFFLSSLLLGGSMTALCNLVSNMLGRAGGEGVSGGGFLLLALAGGGITLLGTHIRRRAGVRTASLTVRVGERRRTVSALCDSGNLVRDPVTGQSVIFLARAHFAALCDESLREVLLGQNPDALTDLPNESAYRVRLVPAGTVQGKTMLLALRPDEVSVDGVPVAALLAPASLSANEDYAAIVPASMATGHSAGTERMD